jgi:hypothetical protein
MAGALGISGAASSAAALNPTNNLGLNSYVNFGAGYIDNPETNTTTPTVTQTPTATSAEGAPASSDTQGGSSEIPTAQTDMFGISETTGVYIGLVVLVVVMLGVGAYLYERKVIK